MRSNKLQNLVLMKQRKKKINFNNTNHQNKKSTVEKFMMIYKY